MANTPNWEDPKFRILHGTMYLWGYELPVCVLHGMIRVCGQHIVCGHRINMDFLRNFMPFKDRTRFLFEQIFVNNELSIRVVLTGVRIYRMTDEEYHEFREDHPDLIEPYFEFELDPIQGDGSDALVRETDESPFESHEWEQVMQIMYRPQLEEKNNVTIYFPKKRFLA